MRLKCQSSSFASFPLVLLFPRAAFKSPYTATSVERLTEATGAGAAVACITNMDEFGMGNDNSHSVHGPALNPYSPAYWCKHKEQQQQQRSTSSSDPAAVPQDDSGSPPSSSLDDISTHWLTPGGSSGGSAVAVATGCALAALGTDTGGSVRQPASFCGLVGLKPSYGRISRYGLIAYASSLDTVGVMARSVGDAALLFDLCRGRDPKDESSCGLQEDQQLRELLMSQQGREKLYSCSSSGEYIQLRNMLLQQIRKQAGGRADSSSDSSKSDISSSSSKPLAGLRVGIPREYRVAELGDLSLQWWERGAALLAAAGAEIVQVSLPTTPHALSAYYLIAPAEASSNLSRYEGVRFGHRSRAVEGRSDSASSSSGAPAGSNLSAAAGADARGEEGGTASASALHQLYTQSRTEGFGQEVQRRILLGTLALSKAGRGVYYKAAQAVRRRVVQDFSAVFRSSPGGRIEEALANEAAFLPFLLGESVPQPSADSETGVDVLLTPTSPTLPWRQDPQPPAAAAAAAGAGVGVAASAAAASSSAASSSVAGYLNDIMTIPASLARLPAISLPVGLVPYASSASSPASDGPCLPIGLQLIGRYCDEDTVLSVTAVLEQSAGFKAPHYVQAPSFRQLLHKLQAAEGHWQQLK